MNIHRELATFFAPQPETPRDRLAGRLQDAEAHLYCAQRQRAPSDCPVIADHIDDALAAVREARVILREKAS